MMNGRDTAMRMLIGLGATLILAATACLAQGTSDQAISPRAAESHRLTTMVPGAVGLAVDSHSTLYTASRETGCVFCIPPSSEPIMIATVPGTPTAIAVDRLRTVFVGTKDAMVYRVSLDGTVSHGYRLDSTPVGLGLDRDGMILAATESGALIRLDRSVFDAAP
jgi:hypothetical protein